MSFTVNGTGTNSQVAGTTVVVSLAIPSGHSVGVLFYHAGLGTLSIADSGTNPYTAGNTVTSTANSAVEGTYYSLAIANSVTTVTLSSTTADFMQLLVYDVTATGTVAYSDSLGNGTYFLNNPGTTDGVTSGLISVGSASSGLVMGLCTNTNGGGTLTFGTGFTGVTFGPVSNFLGEYKAVSANAAATYTDTANQSPLVMGLMFVEAGAAPSPQPPEDAWDFCYDDTDDDWVIEAANTTSAIPNAPIAQKTPDEDLNLWWEDYDEPVVEDSQWSWPVVPNAPPLPTEDQWIWTEEIWEDDLTDDAYNVRIANFIAPTVTLIVDDSWNWFETEEYLFPLVESYQQQDAVIVLPGLGPEDAWDWAEDETSTFTLVESYQQQDFVAPLPSLGPEDAWYWEEEFEDELVILDDANFNAPQPAEDVQFDDEVGDPWEDTLESGPVGPSAAVVPPQLAEETQYDDEVGDDWEATLEYTPVGPNKPQLASNGAEDQFFWDEENTADDWFDVLLDDGSNVQNPNFIPPVITGLPSDVGFFVNFGFLMLRR